MASNQFIRSYYTRLIYKDIPKTRRVQRLPIDFHDFLKISHGFCDSQNDY